MSVVAPVYNKASTLPEFVRRVRAAFGGIAVEVILVDDSSDDNSREVARALDATLVERPRRGGQNAAVLTGLRAATGRTCCVLDVDLEDPPEGLPALVSGLRAAGGRVVFSSRDEAKAVTSRLFRRTLRALFPTLPRHPCLCFAIDDATRRLVVRHAEEGDYLPAVIGALGVPTSQVSIGRGARGPDSSAYGTWKRVRYAAAALRSAVGLRFGDRIRASRPPP